MIGHRGAPVLAPENTLPSFAAALAAGVVDLECDARLTADGVIVLMHDDDVARTTDGDGRVSEMTFEQLRLLDAGARMRGWDGGPVAVPTLEELLEVIDGRASLVIELKADWDDRGFRPASPVARAVAPLVAGMEGIVVSSFDPGAVAEVRALAPGIQTGLSILRGFPLADGIRLAREAGHEEIHPAEDGLDDDAVARAHDAGLRVCCWTVNDAARARVLSRAGVDAIFSDDPAGIHRALSEA